MTTNRIRTSSINCVFLIAVFVFVSINTAFAAEKRIEAEQMKLTNYQVEKSGNTTFIKLTGSMGSASFTFNLSSGW